MNCYSILNTFLCTNTYIMYDSFLTVANYIFLDPVIIPLLFPIAKEYSYTYLETPTNVPSNVYRSDEFSMEANYVPYIVKEFLGRYSGFHFDGNEWSLLERNDRGE